MKLFLILVFTPSLAFPSISMEVRTPLNKRGYNKIKKFIEGKRKVREDYYLDLFNGSSYILTEDQAENRPLKLRVKSSKNKAKLQVSRKIYRDQFSCGEIFLEGTKKESIQKNIQKNTFIKLRESFTKMLNGLEEQNPNLPLFSQGIWKVVFSNLPSIGKDAINQKINERKYAITPTHYVKKFITKKLFTTSYGDVEVSIREIIDYDSTQKAHYSYELEVEPEENTSSWTPEKLSHWTCKALQLNTILNINDINGEKYQRKAHTLLQLHRSADLLGF